MEKTILPVAEIIPALHKKLVENNTFNCDFIISDKWTMINIFTKTGIPAGYIELIYAPKILFEFGLNNGVQTYKLNGLWTYIHDTIEYFKIHNIK